MNAMPLFVSALGWALIDFLWQGALVGCAAAIALMLLRNARPQTRYALCCTALALCLALPAFGFWHGLHADAATRDATVARFVQLAGSPRMQVAGTTTSIAPDASFARSLSWIVALWSLGAAVLAARMATGMMWVARAGRAHGMPHPRWQRRLDRLAEKLGVECKVGLRVVAELATPVAAGCWRPVVLLPASLIAQMPLDLVEALLAHELAHVCRHDYLVNLIQSAIEALLFYHPVVWWLSRRIRIEREQIADDLAAGAIGEPRRLALALHELDLFQQRLREAGDHDGLAVDSLLPAATGGHLMSRIQRLVRPNPHVLSWNIALPIIGLSAICMAVYAQGTHDASTAPQTSAASAIVSSTTTAAVPSAPARLASTPQPGQPHVRMGKASTVLARATNRDEDTYAIVRDGQDSIRMSGDSDNMPAIEKTRKQVHGDFIWVRRGHKVYVVQDPSVIAGVLDVMKPEQALDAQMEVLDKKMEGPNQHMEELNRRMEALDTGQHPYSETMERLGKQIEVIARHEAELGVKQAGIGLRMDDAKQPQRAELDRQMQTLKIQMAPLEVQMKNLDTQMEEQSRQIESAQKPIEELGRQMEEAGNPMEEIGKQMEVLGKQEEQLSRQIDQKVEALIDEAVRAGKAMPGDGTHLE